MIYSFNVTATESRQVKKIMKIRANNEEEARELCSNLLKSDLDSGNWTPAHSGIGNISNKHISGLLWEEIE